MANLTPQVRFHYDFLAPFYYLLWGEHVHHGYWTDAADPAPQRMAQERLIDELYSFGGRPQPRHMIDVGCGYAGSLLWFGQRTQTRGLGITISPLQKMWAQLRIRRRGCQERLGVKLADAQGRWPVADGGVDFVWCCEMTEHLRDRAHWAREAYRVLEPGGTLCLAAWLAGTTDVPDAVALHERVARDTVGYPFSTARNFEGWLRDAGFEAIQTRIITPHIVRTWELAMDIRDRPWLRSLAHLIGGDIERYTHSFDDLHAAFSTGAMEYGLFTARKP